MKEPLISRVLKYTLCVIFLIGAAALITLPFMLGRYMLWLYDAYTLQEGYRLFVLLFLETVGCLGLWIIAELIVILRTVSRDPFVQRNVRALKRIGAVATAISALFFLKCAYYVTLLTLVSGIVMLVCAMMVFTVAVLFAKAVRYKEENELTI